jgi:ArsR family transcriptional regulator
MYQPTADQKQRAAIFKALSDPTRVAIFEWLRTCCPTLSVDEETREVRPVLDGPTLGEVCCTLTGAEQVTSTFSRHCKELHEAGLITLERRGKSVVCAIDPEGVAALVGYLTPAAAACCDTPTVTLRPAEKAAREGTELPCLSNSASCCSSQL